MNRCVIVIPARMGATRFPGKPLVNLHGKPMVQWVYEASVASGVADEVIVAAPDQEIIDAVSKFGARGVLTRHDHQTGTDRLAEVAELVPASVYVNVQGDEPLIMPSSIAACVQPILDNPKIQMSSVYSICPENEFDQAHVVKVVTDKEGFALYFSRYAIPFARNARVIPVKKHVGLYAFSREALLGFKDWPMGDLESAESLEQLRFMENGVRIFMVQADGTELAVDTPEQAAEVEAFLIKRHG